MNDDPQVLIVDDMAQWRELHVKELGDRGLRTMATGSGEEGVQLAHDFHSLRCAVVDKRLYFKPPSPNFLGEYQKLQGEDVIDKIRRARRDFTFILVTDVVAEAQEFLDLQMRTSVYTLIHKSHIEDEANRKKCYDAIAKLFQDALGAASIEEKKPGPIVVVGYDVSGTHIVAQKGHGSTSAVSSGGKKRRTSGVPSMFVGYGDLIRIFAEDSDDSERQLQDKTDQIIANARSCSIFVRGRDSTGLTSPRSQPRPQELAILKVLADKAVKERPVQIDVIDFQYTPRPRRQKSGQCIGYLQRGSKVDGEIIAEAMDNTARPRTGHSGMVSPPSGRRNAFKTAISRLKEYLEGIGVRPTRGGGVFDRQDGTDGPVYRAVFDIQMAFFDLDAN